MANSLTSTIQSIGQAFGVSQSTTNLISGIGGVIGGFSAADQYGQAADTAYQGGQLAALSYRDAGDSAVEYSQYNAKINSMNLAQQLSDLSIQQSQTMSLQRLQMSASGVSLGSQSYLAVASASIDSFARKRQSMQIATGIANQSTLFQGQLAKTQAINQANQAEYQSKVQAAQYSKQQEDQEFNSFLGLASGVASFFF